MDIMDKMDAMDVVETRSRERRRLNVPEDVIGATFAGSLCPRCEILRALVGPQIDGALAMGRLLRTMRPENMTPSAWYQAALTLFPFVRGLVSFN